jgi:hypothetical protein
LILTAADGEDDAVRQVDEGAVGAWLQTPGPEGFGFMLSALGRREEALGAAREAVEIYGRLVERFPQAFLQNYAISLGNLVDRLRECGQSPEADPLVAESRERLRRLEGSDEEPA